MLTNLLLPITLGVLSFPLGVRSWFAFGVLDFNEPFCDNPPSVFLSTTSGYFYFSISSKLSNGSIPDFTKDCFIGEM